MTERKVAIVTGGGSGIGRSCSMRLASDGLAVAVTDLNKDSAEAVAEEIRQAGDEAVAVQCDVSERALVNEAVERVRAELGPPLVLVNNAGIPGTNEFLAITDEKWEKILRVNLTGTFYSTQTVVPDMIEAGWGRIVNISSSSAQGGQPYMVHYVSSKAAVIGFTKALALELGPKGITVNTIPPGFVDTPMLRGIGAARTARRVRRLPRGADAGPAGGEAGRHRLRLLVSRLGGGQLHHRPDHRRQRRTQHLSRNGHDNGTS